MSAVSDAPAQTPKHYNRGPLYAASVRFFRAAGILIFVIMANAVVQGVLISFAVVPQLSSPLFWLLAILSIAALLISGQLIATAALEVWAGRVSIKRTIAIAIPHTGTFAIWIVVWAVIVLIGLSFYTWPGLIILAITPYYPLAAADGHHNPLFANFKAIRERIGRYVITLVITAVLMVALSLLGSLFNFLIFGGWAAFFAMLVVGLVASWLAIGWALVYRSTAVGMAGDV